nr:N(4)-acetylcytidine aminohydrolase [Shewanella litorisediminis]
MEPKVHPTKITFYERFEPIILSGDKTITIRDEAESHYVPGTRVAVHTYETDRWFCDIEIRSVTPIQFDDLNEEHARQEHLSLEDLKRIIRDIYPELDSLYVIEYRLLARDPAG